MGQTKKSNSLSWTSHCLAFHIWRPIIQLTATTSHTTYIMSSPTLERTTSQDDIESGYASATSENGGFADIYLNKQLNQLEPQDILKWCATSLPGLFQTTAFGLT